MREEWEETSRVGEEIRVVGEGTIAGEERTREWTAGVKEVGGTREETGTAE